MNKVLKSLNSQDRSGTLERNTIIALRANAGERYSDLAREFKMNPSSVKRIVDRHNANRKAIIPKDNQAIK
jgi:hypothetical protein